MYAKFHLNLMKLCKFRKFVISGAGIGPMTAEVISKIMTTNQNFGDYDISSNLIGDEGIIKISDALVNDNCKHIMSLDVNTNSLSNEGISHLLKSISNNESLIDLNISSKTKEGKNKNKMGERACRILKDLLTNN